MPDNSSLASGIARIKAIAEDVYSTLGSGFSEDVYDRAMQVGLRLAKIPYEGQKVIELKYKDHYVGEGYPDLVPVQPGQFSRPPLPQRPDPRVGSSGGHRRHPGRGCTAGAQPMLCLFPGGPVELGKAAHALIVGEASRWVAAACPAT